MASEKLRERAQIDDRFKWDIQAMYPNEDDWEKDVNFAVDRSKDFTQFKNHLTESAKTLLDALKMRDEIYRKLEHAMTYAHMKKDEDNRVAKYVAMDDKAGAAYAKIAANMSFFAPELLACDAETIEKYIAENDELKVYEFCLKDALRAKAHILSAAEENVLAQLGEVLDAPHDIFTMLNNTEMKFGKVHDEDGNLIELTHGNYISLMQSHNREVREEAFTHMYEAYKNMSNTLSSMYNFNVKKSVVRARLKNYTSARAQALSGANIPEEVYDNLISVVHEYLPVLHKYLALRKKVLGVDELKMHDVYVPLVKLPKKEYTFEEAVDVAIKGLAPMGEEYLSKFIAGTKDGWMDVYENVGKTSGAYSFGSYDSKPYVLLNFSSSLKDIFTIAHEMGHSMHSYFTRHNQPYIYGDYSIFAAEVASTVNEALLIRHMIANETNLEVKKYLINYHIEEFRTTLFRQTMFAEFEYLAHKEVEAGGVLTSEWLLETYDKLNSDYFGPALSHDDYIKYEWSRIPHFYRNFYVYQYATGYSAATAISSKILAEGKPAVDNYMKFLKGGSSDYPVELLKLAGVDMSSPEPVRLAMEAFSKLVDELEGLLA